ncbi:MAG TPA: hypothetical protein VJ044_10400, partial [Candidatus Hodarchaeales archaeon]|nr:hypothetical protein [Candidatus Hodarchaeales archaeon]
HAKGLGEHQPRYFILKLSTLVKIMFGSLKESLYDSIERGWKSFSEGASVNRIMSTYLLSYLTSFPESERFQINVDTFLKCLAQPKAPIGSVLILQGGIRHMDSNTYYVRTACSFIPSCARIFLYEKLLPMVNFEFAHDIAACLDYIRTNFPGPIVVIGYSMGGVLLYSYLSLGYDQADLYLPVCCPLDLDRFHETICDHTLFRFLQEKSYERYQVNDHDELLELAGSNRTQHQKFVDDFIPGLNRHRGWSDKTIYIVSTDDPITPDYRHDLAKLNYPPLTYQVQGGWHCCLNSIFLSARLTGAYLQACHDGEILSPTEICPHTLF